MGCAMHRPVGPRSLVRRWRSSDGWYIGEGDPWPESKIFSEEIRVLEQWIGRNGELLDVTDTIVGSEASECMVVSTSGGQIQPNATHRENRIPIVCIRDGTTGQPMATVYTYQANIYDWCVDVLTLTHVKDLPLPEYRKRMEHPPHKTNPDVAADEPPPPMASVRFDRSRKVIHKQDPLMLLDHIFTTVSREIWPELYLERRRQIVQPEWIADILHEKQRKHFK